VHCEFLFGGLQQGRRQIPMVIVAFVQWVDVFRRCWSPSYRLVLTLASFAPILNLTLTRSATMNRGL
jgi:hypothetical protein